MVDVLSGMKLWLPMCSQCVALNSHVIIYFFKWFIYKVINTKLLTCNDGKSLHTMLKKYKVTFPSLFGLMPILVWHLLNYNI